MNLYKRTICYKRARAFITWKEENCQEESHKKWGNCQKLICGVKTWEIVDSAKHIELLYLTDLCFFIYLYLTERLLIKITH